MHFSLFSFVFKLKLNQSSLTKAPEISNQGSSAASFEALIVDRLRQTNGLKELFREAQNVPETGDEEREV